MLVKAAVLTRLRQELSLVMIAVQSSKPLWNGNLKHNILRSSTRGGGGGEERTSSKGFYTLKKYYENIIIHKMQLIIGLLIQGII